MTNKKINESRIRYISTLHPEDIPTSQFIQNSEGTDVYFINNMLNCQDRIRLKKLDEKYAKERQKL